MSESIHERTTRIIFNHLNQELRSLNFDAESPLIEIGIGVDSVSTLELIMTLEKEFGIDIDESEITAEVLYSISTLSEYIEKQLQY